MSGQFTNLIVANIGAEKLHLTDEIALEPFGVLELDQNAYAGDPGLIEAISFLARSGRIAVAPVVDAPKEQAA